jgi:pimeloyl-ACP methyl ester carboxylesterase
MNMVCMGHGTPTVVFESGAGEHILTWQKIQTGVSDISHVCFYDRAGFGFSDPSPKPVTAMAVADDLHALLQHAGIKGPVVLAGHSLGGLYATLYADRFPDEVAGLLLIDPTIPQQGPNPFKTPEERAGWKAAWEAIVAGYRYCAGMARNGYLARGYRTHTHFDPCYYPAPSRTKAEADYLMAVDRKPYIYETILSEFESSTPADEGPDEDSLEETRAARTYGAMPLLVLVHGGKDRPDTEALKVVPRLVHQLYDHRSSRLEIVIVPNSDHFIQLDQPQAVIDAVRKMVDELRESAGA